jgi:hypothetical protein
MTGQQHSAQTHSIQPGRYWKLQAHSGSELQLPSGQQHQMKKLLFSKDAGIVDQIKHSNNSCKDMSVVAMDSAKHTQFPALPTAHVEKFLDAAAHFQVLRLHTG